VTFVYTAQSQNVLLAVGLMLLVVPPSTSGQSYIISRLWQQWMQITHSFFMFSAAIFARKYVTIKKYMYL